MIAFFHDFMNDKGTFAETMLGAVVVSGFLFLAWVEVWWRR
jgi:hypothetical protein